MAKVSCAVLIQGTTEGQLSLSGSTKHPEKSSCRPWMGRRPCSGGGRPLNAPGLRQQCQAVQTITHPA